VSKFRHGNASRDAHIASLRLIIGVLAMLLAGTGYGWYQAPQDMTIHNPPDLRSGSTRKWWEVPPSTVYSFAFYVWQQINHWPKDGEDDYKDNLRRYRAYLTPACQTELSRNYEQRLRRSELDDRVRTLQEIPGHGYQSDDVTLLGRDRWIVSLNAQINEYLHGTPVRDLYIRYFLQVVRSDVDPETNPFGLQLDCFAEPAVRLTRSRDTPESENTDISSAEAGTGED
jgi:integrating conjugative element protein (TIGR03746 family)